MSQISLSFKNRILSVHPINQQNSTVIGNTPDSQIHIDNLAVSPQHARISYIKPDYHIEALDEKAIILINDKQIESSEILSDGDIITIGKYTLRFSFNEDNVIFKQEEEEKIKSNQDDGWIQYLNGPEMGKTVRIAKITTEISDADKDNIAMISNRSNGFYISYLKGKEPPMINNQRIGEKSELLADDSKILLGRQEILFYLS